jgi:hypothetical protein
MTLLRHVRKDTVFTLLMLLQCQPVTWNRMLGLDKKTQMM